MKKIILAAILAYLPSLIITAQENPAKPKGDKSGYAKAKTEERALALVNGISSKVSMDDEQKKKIYDLALLQVEQEKTIKAKYRTTTDKSGLQSELDANRNQYTDALKKVLTPEQLTLLTSHQKN